MKGHILVKKGKGFTYSLPSVGPGADPSVQAVSPQVRQAVGCHYFPPGLTFPAVEAHRYEQLVTEAQGMNNLPKVVTQLLPRVGFDPTTC